MKNGAINRGQINWLRQSAMVGLALLITARLMTPAYAVSLSQSDNLDFPDFVLASICIGNGIVDGTPADTAAVPPCPLCVMGGCVVVGTPSSSPTVQSLAHLHQTLWHRHIVPVVNTHVIDSGHPCRAPPFVS